MLGKIVTFHVLILYLLVLFPTGCYANVVINTWRFSGATEAAWRTLLNSNDVIDALEAGGSYCEAHQCDFTVGFGGSPDESGETTLDAMIFDGKTMDVGAVADLRRVKNAISIAKHVLKYTDHTFLVGDQATSFAVSMGFTEEDLSTNVSAGIWQNWRNDNCQPNYWKNVEPNPTMSCGPYSPLSENSIYYGESKKRANIDRFNHDTIGIIVLDNDGNIGAATSTNGARHKIPGRVGDSPIPGAGAYADNNVGAACATGDGDIMMRFLPSFLAVELMRNGASPTDAAKEAVKRITTVYPAFSGAVIAVSSNGEYGAACNGMVEFPFSVRNDSLDEVNIVTVNCADVSKADQPIPV